MAKLCHTWNASPAPGQLSGRWTCARKNRGPARGRPPTPTPLYLSRRPTAVRSRRSAYSCPRSRRTPPRTPSDTGTWKDAAEEESARVRPLKLQRACSDGDREAGRSDTAVTTAGTGTAVWQCRIFSHPDPRPRQSAPPETHTHKKKKKSIRARLVYALTAKNRPPSSKGVERVGARAQIQHTRRGARRPSAAVAHTHTRPLPPPRPRRTVPCGASRRWPACRPGRAPSVVQGGQRPTRPRGGGGAPRRCTAAALANPPPR